MQRHMGITLRLRVDLLGKKDLYPQAPDSVTMKKKKKKNANISIERLLKT